MTRPAGRVRLAAAIGVLAVVGVACAAAPAPTAEAGDTAAAEARLDGVVAVGASDRADADLDGLDAALDAVASGFLAADPDAVRPWLLDPASAFGQAWLARAANLAGVPLAHYGLRLDPSLPDLATARVRSAYGPRAHVVYVREEHAIEGFDANGPATDDLFLTVVDTPDGWRFAGDRDAEPLGLVSADHLWDQGPVEVTGSGPVVALHHPGTPSVAAVVGEARAALDAIAAEWPLAWEQRVPLIIPRDQDELAELLHVTFDVSNFVAFATSTVVGERGEYRLTGTRIVVNPPRFLDRSSEARRRTLEHEMLHVATRPVSGPFVPAWVEEGLAQRLGEGRSTTGLGLLTSLVAGGRFDGALPADNQFTTGGQDRIFLSYQTAFSFLDHLVATYGTGAVAAFYAELGQGSVGEPGREAWHVDRAARAVFGSGIDELRDAWRGALAGA